jgi:hypothetical protein
MQATIQMQLAAQRVAHENARLKSLLNEVGVSDETIGTWLSKNASSDDDGNCCPSLKLPTQTTVQEQTLAHRPEAGKVPEEPRNVERAASSSSSLSGTCTSGDLRSQKSSSVPPESSIPQSDTSPKQICASSCKKNSLLFQTLKPATAPCRLLAPATDNATADFMQSPALSRVEQQIHNGDELETHSHGGIECSTAYKTLMQYATSQDKMDRITAALDYGCTPDGAGGCKVKSNVMWKILDEEC